MIRVYTYTYNVGILAEELPRQMLNFEQLSHLIALQEYLEVSVAGRGKVCAYTLHHML